MTLIHLFFSYSDNVMRRIKKANREDESVKERKRNNIWKAFENTHWPKSQTYLRVLWIWAAWTMSFYLNILLIGKVWKGYMMMDAVWLMDAVCGWWTLCVADGRCVWLMDAVCGWWTLCVADGRCVWLMDAVCGWWTLCVADGCCVWLMDAVYGWWTLCMADGRCVWLMDAVCGWWTLCVADGRCVWLMDAVCGWWTLCVAVPTGRSICWAGGQREYMESIGKFAD